MFWVCDRNIIISGYAEAAEEQDGASASDGGVGGAGFMGFGAQEQVSPERRGVKSSRWGQVPKAEEGVIEWQAEGVGEFEGDSDEEDGVWPYRMQSVDQIGKGEAEKETGTCQFFWKDSSQRWI